MKLFWIFMTQYKLTKFKWIEFKHDVCCFLTTTYSFTGIYKPDLLFIKGGSFQTSYSSIKVKTIRIKYESWIWSYLSTHPGFEQMEKNRNLQWFFYGDIHILRKHILRNFWSLAILFKWKILRIGGNVLKKKWHFWNQPNLKWIFFLLSPLESFTKNG